MKKPKERVTVNVRYAHLPPRFKHMKGRQERIVLNYSSPVKLKAVARWKERMAKQNIKVKDLAEKIGKPAPRISEWVNFRVEPTEENFNLVENALYDLGV